MENDVSGKYSKMTRSSKWVLTMLWQQEKDGISETNMKYYGFLKHKRMIRKKKQQTQRNTGKVIWELEKLSSSARLKKTPAV